MTDDRNPLYPQTDDEWRAYCAEAKRILIENSNKREMVLNHPHQASEHKR